MDFTQDERNSTKNLTGITVVVLLHVFIVYALVTGLARKVVEVIKQPIETKIIEEIKPPPPPPDKPLPPPPPKVLAPPPPFIPPPEVQVQQQPQPNTISAVSNVQPDNPVLPRPVAAEVSPAATPVRVAAVTDFSSCAKPEYPRNSQRNEETGTVVLQFLIGVDGRVIDSKVQKSTGFKDLDKAARQALSLCKFKPGTTDGKPEQSWTKVEYVWKLE